jgi:phosphoglycolate phosphatase
MIFTHLLFDLDGTLIDSKRGIFNAVHYTLDKMGIAPESRPTNLNPFIGPPLRDSFRDLFNFNDKVAEAATVTYREYYGKQGLFEFDIYDGIPESMQFLHKKGFQISLVTSKAEEYAERIIASTPFSNCFNTISGCELDGRRSTKQELIFYTLDKLYIDPSPEILMIGDRYHDIRGARMAGVSSAAVLYGYGSREELTAESPSLFIKSTSDFMKLTTQNL